MDGERDDRPEREERQPGGEYETDGSGARGGGVGALLSWHDAKIRVPSGRATTAVGPVAPWQG